MTRWRSMITSRQTPRFMKIPSAGDESVFVKRRRYLQWHTKVPSSENGSQHTQDNAYEGFQLPSRNH